MLEMLEKYNFLSDSKNSAIDDQFKNKLHQESVNVKSPTTQAEMPENKPKNRFKNILPYDHSRVIISKNNYINASFIDSFSIKKKYIASQGPIPRTVNDFWTMITEQDCSLIVMLTNILERGKAKCEKYWPEPGETVQYGNISVKMEYESTYGSYIERTFLVQGKDDQYQTMTMTVTQLQFISWPDHGVPSTTSSFLRFYSRVEELYNEQRGKSPVVVHCSAGVGRTGTFIGFDSLMQEMKEKRSVNIFETVLNMRRQRTDMVQTKGQYMFLHKLVAEVNLFGNTDVAVNDLGKAITSTRLQNELIKIEKIGPSQTSHDIALLPQNIEKNLNDTILPYDHAMFILAPLPNDYHPSYYNASFITGYNTTDTILAAQTPTYNTVVEFWHGVWCHKLDVIVMLSQIHEKLKRENTQYWPDSEGETLRFGSYKIQLLSVEKFGIHITKRKLIISLMNNHFEVTHYQLFNWKIAQAPNCDVIIDLIEKAQKSCLQSGGNMAVHCSDGAGRTGVFIGALNLIERIKNENKVDVLRTVKDMRDMRPGMVENLAQYQSLYEIAVKYIDSLSNYQNFVPLKK